MKRIVAVFTGNRAEYGLQYPVLKAIKEHPELEYRLIVAGAHLDPNFGQSIAEIRRDGFEIHAEVKIDLGEDSRLATSRAIATGILSLGQALNDLRPDLLVVYADRFEGFAAVISGTQMNIPTAHIEGGDITEGGALDDSVRHAMTKLAHLHFTTNQQATNRLLAMGEEPWRVTTAGFPAIDLIVNGQVASPEQLKQQYGLRETTPLIVFTQHSVTTEFDEVEAQLGPSLRAIRRLADEGVQVILTFPNNDVGGLGIVQLINRFMADAPPALQLHKSLGRFNYHGFLALARVAPWRVACVGNSSSGIKETPVFGCPAVNIGSRQLGRLRGDNVLDAGYDEAEIYAAVKQALFDDGFRARCRQTTNPYGGGSAGKIIAEKLAGVPLDPKVILRKRMMLLGEARDGWYR